MIPRATGEPRRFVPNAEVVAQLEEMAPLAHRAPGELMWRRLRAARSEPGYVSDEVVVYLFRRYHVQGQHQIANDLSALLADRIARRLGNYLRSRLPGKPWLHEEIVNHAQTALWSALLDLRSDFAEANFSVFCTRHAIDAMRQLPIDTQSIDEPGGDDAASPSIGDRLPDSHDPILAADDDMALLELLACLPEPALRRAVYYRFIGFPVEDADDPRHSISGLLGVTPRTVRNYFTRAQKMITEKEVGRHVRQH